MNMNASLADARRRYYGGADATPPTAAPRAMRKTMMGGSAGGLSGRQARRMTRTPKPDPMPMAAPAPEMPMAQAEEPRRINARVQRRTMM